VGGIDRASEPRGSSRLSRRRLGSHPSKDRIGRAAACIHRDTLPRCDIRPGRVAEFSEEADYDLQHALRLSSSCCPARATITVFGSTRGRATKPAPPARRASKVLRDCCVSRGQWDRPWRIGGRVNSSVRSPPARPLLADGSPLSTCAQIAPPPRGGGPNHQGSDPGWWLRRHGGGRRGGPVAAEGGTGGSTLVAG